MAMQRNNLARLPWEVREIAARLRFDGAGNQAIAEAVQAACRQRGIRPPRIHGTTILAYTKSAEYQRYCDQRRKWDDRLAPRRWAAALLNEGKGPQSVADLAELEILEQLHDLAAGGLLETGKDVATVARAITAMQRTQLARRQEEADARLRDAERAHAEEAERLRSEIKKLQGEIDRLVNPQADERTLTPEERIARIRERLGIA